MQGSPLNLYPASAVPSPPCPVLSPAPVGRLRCSPAASRGPVRGCCQVCKGGWGGTWRGSVPSPVASIPAALERCKGWTHPISACPAPASPPPCHASMRQASCGSRHGWGGGVPEHDSDRRARHRARHKARHKARHMACRRLDRAGGAMPCAACDRACCEAYRRIYHT